MKAKTADELFSKYQQAVKVNDYEDLRPYVERHKHGDSDILFPGKPKMYATTSGTTSEPKWIPITNKYYDDVYSKMTKMWLWSFMHNRPKVFEGRALSIVGKAIEGQAPDGTVFGSVSGVTQRDCPEFIKYLYSAPADLFRIADYKSRYYAIMRMGIEQNVHSIITANPSTIVEMQNNVNEFFDDYCNDIENGTISSKVKIDDDIRKALLAKIKPNPERAKELRDLKKQHEIILPKHYWPELQILTTWKCGNTKVYMEKFKHSFPENCMHLEFGYFASECRPGLVIDGESDNTILFPHRNFLEFTHISDLDNPNPKFYQLHELKVGEKYCMYITTFAGLYRYNMNDLIEVKDYYKSVPCIQFIQKVNGIISMTGEKLHERQFIQAVHDAEKQTGLTTKFFVGFADLDTSGYKCYFEFADQSVNQKQCDEFTAKVDENLKKINIEYEAKRDSLRIIEAKGFLLQKDSFETYKARCIEQGARDGQFKLNLLMQDEKRHAMFKDLVK